VIGWRVLGDEPDVRRHGVGQSLALLQFLKGQEPCQIAFGMYDLQINWGDGGLSCIGRVIYAPSAGGEVVWNEGYP